MDNGISAVLAALITAGATLAVSLLAKRGTPGAPQVVINIYRRGQAAKASGTRPRGQLSLRDTGKRPRRLQVEERARRL